jgi:hypothetical protein
VADDLFAREFGVQFALSSPFIGIRSLTAPQGKRHFGQLRGFARARFATHDDDLMRLHGSHDFLASD